MDSLLRRVTAPLRQRHVTNVVRTVLDDWLPPVVREYRPLNRALASMFFSGGEFDLDFKDKAFAMTDAEMAATYARLGTGQRYRDSDTTPAQMDEIVAGAVGPRVLEVGCGNGALSARLHEAGFDVTATDVAPDTLADAGPGAQGRIRFNSASLPNLPFPDGAFDTVVCAHTLEHIPRVQEAAKELMRVCARKLVVVVPRQRWYRYTIDYHIHFFPWAAPLAALFPGLRVSVRRVDGDWLLEGERA